MKRKVVTVSDVNRYVNRLIGEDYVLGDLWISGEVSNCKYHHTGHIYFTLKDTGASVNVVMFAREATQLTIRLIDGMRIYARTRMALYEKTGAYQGYVTEIEQQGVGTLYEAFERLKYQLTQKGLFDSNYKKELPVYPRRIGVITSKTGAAIKDIIHVAKRRNPSIALYIYPVHVQGEYAKSEIVQAIQKANEDAQVDLLIVGRGGGSIEDLWAFNEESVAHAIFDSKIPVISAVGHEVDFTIADFVADVRAATPSAAAELAVPDRKSYLKRIESLQERSEYRLAQHIQRERTKLKQLKNRPVYKYKDQVIKNKMVEVVEQTEKLEKQYRYHLEKRHYQLVKLLTKVDDLSPLKTLARGYAWVTKVDDEKLITSTKQLEIGDKVRITLSEGVITGCVEEKG